MDLNTIIQSLLVLALTGLVSAIWIASLTLAKLGAAFEAHKERDEADFERLGEAIKDASEIAHAALYGGKS